MSSSHRPDCIDSIPQLVRSLRSGGTLRKSHAARRPVFEVRGQLCDPIIVREVLARGWLRPLDPGLFGPESAQSFELAGVEHE